jgi:universal stress protein A
MVKIRPKRILWPTDFSNLSLKAGLCAFALCEVFKAELHVVHVCPPPLAPHIQALLPAEVISSLTDAELINATRTRLKQLVAEQFRGNRAVVCEALVGHPSSEICAYAQRARIDLLVVATHGMAGLRHVLIGSTADRIVQHATCPVLTVKSLEPDFVGG